MKHITKTLITGILLITVQYVMQGMLLSNRNQRTDAATITFTHPNL